MPTIEYIDQLRHKAREALDSRDTELALSYYEELANLHLPDGYFTSGILYENMAWEKNDDEYLTKAWSHYLKLMTEFSESEGYIGCARIILARKDANRARLAESYCLEAIEIDDNPFAYLVLGRVYESFGLPGKTKQAMHAYLRAAFKGAAFGMRGFARVHWRHGSKTIAILAHVIATMLSPIYRLLGGSRALRSG